MLPAGSIMSFGDHLDELRKRLVYSLLGVAVFFIASLALGGGLLDIVAAPVLHELKAAGQSATLLATSPLETFGAYMKVATVMSLLVGMPWVLYQTWQFISPGLYPHEQRFVYVLMPMSVGLTAIGVLMLYYVVLPLSLYFLISFGSGLIGSHVTTAPTPEGIVLPAVPTLSADPSDAAPGSMWINQSVGQLRFRAADGRTLGVALSSGGTISQQYRISEYVDLVFMMALAFAIAFQVPMVLMLLAWSGLLKPEDLTRYRKQVFFGCVIGAALLPTQDPGSLLALSAMLIGLFELGIVLMRVMPKRLARLAPAESTDGDLEA